MASTIPYLPGDPRLVDQIVCELKSQGIFDQFRKDCIADVDTKPAYQNLRQRVDTSVSNFLARQKWSPDMNKNQLRERLRKHILDSNFLDQGVERIVDQVVNPKVSSVFIPKVEEVVYRYLGIEHKLSNPNQNYILPLATEELLPTDLEAVSPDSGKSNDHKHVGHKSVEIYTNKAVPTDFTGALDNTINNIKLHSHRNSITDENNVVPPNIRLHEADINDHSEFNVRDHYESNQSNIEDTNTVCLANIPQPDILHSDSQLSHVSTSETNLSDTQITSEDCVMDDEVKQIVRNKYQSEDMETSSDSDLRKNMSPLTPVRSYNENSSEAQPAFEQSASLPVNDDLYNIMLPKDQNPQLENKEVVKDVGDTFPKNESMPFIYLDDIKLPEQPEISDLPIHTPVTSMENQENPFQNRYTYSEEDSSMSNNLKIDYQSPSEQTNDKEDGEVDTNSTAAPLETEYVKSKEVFKSENNKSSHSSSKDRSSSRHHHRKSDDKHSKSRNQRDSQRNDHHRKSSESHRHDSHSKSRDRKDSNYHDRSKDKDKSSRYSSTDRKDSHSLSKSHTKSHSSSSSKHRHSSSSSSNKHISLFKQIDHYDKHKESKDGSKLGETKDSKSHSSRTDIREKEKTSSLRLKSSSSRSDRDRKHSSSCSTDKKDDRKENKNVNKKNRSKIVDDHYSSSGRGRKHRRSTDRDSNDGNSNPSKPGNSQSTSKALTNYDQVNTSSSNNKSNSTSSTNESSPSDPTESDFFQDMIVIDEVNETSSDTVKSENCDGIKSDLESMNNHVSKILKSPVKGIENQLNTPMLEAQKLTVPNDLKKVKKPRFASNLEEARKLIKIRKQIDIEEQKRQQGAVMLLEMRENIQPNTSQVFSAISGPELEFTCYMNLNNVNSSQETAENSGKSSVENLNLETEDENAKMKSANTNKDIIREPQSEESNVLVLKPISTDDENVKMKSASTSKDVIPELQSEVCNVLVFKPISTEDENVKIKSSSTNRDVIPERQSEEECNILLFKPISIEDENVKIKSNNRDIIRGLQSEECNVLVLKPTINDNTQIVTKALVVDEILMEAENKKEPMNDTENKFCYFEELRVDEKEKYDSFTNKFNEIYESLLKNNQKKLHVLNCSDYELEVISKVCGNVEVVNFLHTIDKHNDTIKVTKDDTLINKENHINLNKINTTIENSTKSDNLAVKTISIKPDVFIEINSSPNEVIETCIRPPEVVNAESPNKSLGSSFESTFEYSSKIDEIMHNTTQQEIMEIIIGGGVTTNDMSLSNYSKMNFEYVAFESDDSMELETNDRKRKADDTEYGEDHIENNNHETPAKIRKIISTDQISSTTIEDQKVPNGIRPTSLGVANIPTITRFKRFGDTKTKMAIDAPHSPSSDKSVENYTQNTNEHSPKSKRVTKSQLGEPARRKSKIQFQRYETSDLYKPKSKFLSRRSNLS